MCPRRVRVVVVDILCTCAGDIAFSKMCIPVGGCRGKSNRNDCFVTSSFKGLFCNCQVRAVSAVRVKMKMRV